MIPFADTQLCAAMTLRKDAHPIGVAASPCEELVPLRATALVGQPVDLLAAGADFARTCAPPGTHVANKFGSEAGDPGDDLDAGTPSVGVQRRVSFYPPASGRGQWHVAVSAARWADRFG